MAICVGKKSCRHLRPPDYFGAACAEFVTLRNTNKAINRAWNLIGFNELSTKFDVRALMRLQHFVSNNTFRLRTARARSADEAVGENNYPKRVKWLTTVDSQVCNCLLRSLP